MKLDIQSDAKSIVHSKRAEIMLLVFDRAVHDRVHGWRQILKLVITSTCRHPCNIPPHSRCNGKSHTYLQVANEDAETELERIVKNLCSSRRVIPTSRSIRISSYIAGSAR